MGLAVYHLNIPTEQWLPLSLELRVLELLKLLVVAIAVYVIGLLLVGIRPGQIMQRD
jgi:hypothetical protein